MLIGQDIGPYGGTFGVTRGLHETYGDEKVRDAPLCESGTVGYAIGLAITGVRAVVRDRVLRLRRRRDGPDLQPGREAPLLHGREADVPLVIRTPIVARMGMGPQHSQSLESWFMHVPGIKIAMPSNAADAYGLMRTRAARHQPGPVHRERAPLRPPRATSTRRRRPIPFGQARDRARGRRTPPSSRCPGMVDEALAAADRLAERGISVEVIDPRTLAPLDMETILGSLRKTHAARGRARRAQDAAASAPRSQRAAWRRRSTTSMRPSSASPAIDVPIPCTPSGIEAVYPGADDVVAAVERLVA